MQFAEQRTFTWTLDAAEDAEVLKALNALAAMGSSIAARLAAARMNGAVPAWVGMQPMMNQPDPPHELTNVDDECARIQAVTAAALAAAAPNGSALPRVSNALAMEISEEEAAKGE